MTAVETDDAVTIEVRGLMVLDLEGLRAAWKSRYGVPPKLRSVTLLRYMLAWRIQEAAWGGLDGDLRQRLRRPGSIAAAAGPRPSVGSIITREYRGQPHAVAVTSEGFIHDGVTYKSLSQVARAITGTRWNGPKFFGLREDPG